MGKEKALGHSKRIRWVLVLLAFSGLAVAILFVVLYFDLFEGSIPSIEPLLPSKRLFTIEMGTIPQFLKAPEESFLFEEAVTEPRIQNLKEELGWNPKEWVDFFSAGVREFEKNVNQRIPLGLLSFRFWRDLFPGEVFFVGTPPEEEGGGIGLILIWRISWRVKIAIPFIQEGTIESGDGRAVLSVLEGGKIFHLRGRDFEAYFTRLKDILIVVNRLPLMRETFARFEATGGGDRGGSSAAQEPGEAESMFSFDVHKAMLVPKSFFKGDEAAKSPFLNAMDTALSLSSFAGFQGDLTRVNEEGICIKGCASFERMTPFSLFKHRNKEREPRRAISQFAGMLPPEVFLLSFLKVSSSRFLWSGIQGLSPEERSLLEDGLKQVPEYSTFSDLLAELDRCFADEIGIVISRQNLESIRQVEILPFPAVVFLFRITDPAIFERFTERIYSREKELFLDQRERMEYGECFLVRLNTHINLKGPEGEPVLDYAYAVIGDWVAFSSSFDFLKVMIDARNRFKPNLDRWDKFQRVLSAFSGEGSISIYLNLAGFADWLDDYCYFLAKIESKPSTEEEIEERERIEKEIAQETGSPFQPSLENDKRIKEALIALREKKKLEIPGRYAAYRRTLQLFRLFSTAGFHLDSLEKNNRVNFTVNLFFE